MASGIDLQYVDPTVRAQDDFYRHVNGKWLDAFEIPADKARYGSFTKLSDDSEAQARELIEAAAKAGGAPGSGQKKIGDLYNTFMDEAKLETLGGKPLAPDLAKIDAIKSKSEIPGVIARFGKTSVRAPYAFAIHQDNKDSTKYIVGFGQSGLGLPDRDYYLKADDAKLHAVLEQYEAHIARLLTLAGDKHATASAKDVVALETAIANIQWTKVENRDPLKTYNKVTVADLPKLVPGYDWKNYLVAAGLDGKMDYVIVSQPTYFTALGGIITSTPLAAWKAYFKWHLVRAAAPLLSKAFVDEDFAFSGGVLSGIPENQPRWKRGVRAVESALGEEVGRLYVAKYFPPENKARMEKLVANLLAAYRTSIDGLDWMSPATKQEAKAKLAKFTPKIGYPKTWRDYSALDIKAGDLLGDMRRAAEFGYQHEINKLGKPIDRDEWGMTPQTVNAYYNAELNEIVFPAAILQPPFFDVNADDAANYGGIGAVIGHEISHGFDDKGSQYDGDGNLRQWFTPEDLAHFKAKTHALVEQYNQYQPVAGYRVNGELTLGENIADNSGLAIAYKAYKLSLGDKPSPVIDGFTGEQRLYLGWVQVWRGKQRDAESIRLVKTDPHSPAQFRGNGPLANQPGFYAAFSIKPGDKMYAPPATRVILW